MIIPEEKIIFIHVPKTGGVTMNTQLIHCITCKHAKYRNLLINSKREFWSKIYLKHKNRNNHPEFKWRDIMHLTALEIIDKIGQNQFNNSFKFAFVRNPWDRVVSYYKYIKQKREDHLEYYGIDKNISFDNFLNVFFEKHGVGAMNFMQPQTNFLFNSSGKNLMDFVGRYENYDEDFDKIYNRLKPQFSKKPVKISKRENAAIDRRHYTEFYNSSTIKLVKKYYIQDVKNFKYEYGK